MSDRTASNIPIVDALKELKFSRPAWTQRMLDAFVVEAEKQCFQYESDGTFNHLVDDVWGKDDHD